MRSLILFILLSLPTYFVSAQANSQLIDEQLANYREAYPEIDFVLLYVSRQLLCPVWRQL